MDNNNYLFEETSNIDECECVYCSHKFNGRDAVNANLDCGTVKCPKCNKEMYVSMSVEYVCAPMEDDNEYE